jgi:hypothetical protein
LSQNVIYLSEYFEKNEEEADSHSTPPVIPLPSIFFNPCENVQKREEKAYNRSAPITIHISENKGKDRELSKSLKEILVTQETINNELIVIMQYLNIYVFPSMINISYYSELFRQKKFFEKYQKIVFFGKDKELLELPEPITEEPPEINNAQNKYYNKYSDSHHWWVESILLLFFGFILGGLSHNIPLFSKIFNFISISLLYIIYYGLFLFSFILVCILLLFPLYVIKEIISYLCLKRDI